eukprot:g18107.t1
MPPALLLVLFAIGGTVSSTATKLPSTLRAYDRQVSTPLAVVEATDLTGRQLQEETCEGGIPGIQVSDVCCLTSCGECAGSGCASRTGDGTFSGQEACCGGGVRGLGRICSDTVGAPCVVSSGSDDESDETCEGGIPGIQVSDVCCPTSCGTCGGSGCASRTGDGTFSGQEACCGGGVRGLGRICSDTVGAPCVVASGSECTDDSECDEAAGEICCPVKQVCEEPISPGACGDPHMTGFRGQKFDFTGQDGGWYAILSVPESLHVNMRVTTPVPSVPEITYITGIAVKMTDAASVDHTIVISVTDPHNLDSDCPVGVSPCLAEGSLTVEIDGETALLAPGERLLGPEVAIAAVNLPGACRSFGFEKYWARKMEEYATAGRRLLEQKGMQDMAQWVLGDPTVTNMMECAEYVASALGGGDAGLLAHDSEHASFQIMTPLGKIRLSHGRLHQLPMRDPTDRFDLPDHLTWQMNVAFDHHDIDPRVATGVLGETLVPTLDDENMPIMQGMGSIRGSEEDYRVAGPLETIFAQGNFTPGL